MATTARDIMTGDPQIVRGSDTVYDAARRMAELGVGAVPICGEDGRLKGVLTDRDVVVKVIAEQHDPRAVKADQLAQGEAVTVGADDSAEEVMATMTEKRVRRLPVIDGNRLVGMVAQADVARALNDPQVGNLVEALSVEYR